MTTTEATLRGFFFARPEDADEALGGTAAGDGLGTALGHMPKAAREAVFAEVGEKAAGVLDLGISDIFRGVWGKQEALRQAAAATLGRPGTEELVEMTTYNLSFEDRPGIEVRVGDLPPAMLSVDVALEITVRGLIAVVRDGRLIALRAGTAEVNGTLSMAGNQVAAQQATLDLVAHIKLGQGIRLAGPGDDRPARGTEWSHRDP